MSTEHRTKEQSLITFQVITDTHVTGDPNHEYNRNFELALQDIAAHCEGSCGIMHIGDITDHGFPEEYDEALRIIDNYKERLPAITFTLGNHDVGLGHWDSRLALYQSHTGMIGPYHDHWVNGFHFIFLGTEKGLRTFCDLTPEQLQWLDYKLGEQFSSGKPIFLFLHQPLKDTVAGSLESQAWYGVTQDEELKAILSKHPQTILFTGHTHWELEAEHTMFPGQGKTATMFNCASVAYLWTNEDKHKLGSQGFYVEVYNDKVLVRGRDFKTGAWVSAAQYEVAFPA